MYHSPFCLKEQIMTKGRESIRLIQNFSRLTSSGNTNPMGFVWVSGYLDENFCNQTL